MSHDWQFTVTGGAMNNHLQKCPHADVQTYDATKIWHCIPSELRDEKTIHQQVPLSSINLVPEN